MQLDHKENYNINKVKLITGVSFLFGFSLAVSAYVLAFYYKEAIGSEKVGVFFLSSYMVVLIVLLNLHKMIKKFGKSASMISFMAIRVLALASLLVFWSKPVLAGSFALVVYVIFGNLSWVSMDIMLESFSADKLSGRIRGLYLTIANTGFILGPFVSFSLLDKYGFVGVFTALLILDFVIFIIMASGLRHINHTYHRSLTILQLFRRVLRRKNVIRIYFISFILDFFYSTMIIYSPMYLMNLGMSLDDMSIIFTIMLIPFVILQYPAGRLADKKWGERKMLIFAFLVMALSVPLISFISTTEVVVWGVVLFATRIGAALVEVLRDSYFYKRIDGSDVGIIDFFRTSKSMAYISFSILSIILLSFLEIKSVFILLSIVCASGIYFAYNLDENSIAE